MRASTRRTLSRVAPALAAVWALASCAPADRTPWPTFSPEGGEFSVLMPGTPERAVQGGASLKARIYLVGPRLYELVAVVPTTDAAGPATGQFLDSFELKEPQT